MVPAHSKNLALVGQFCEIPDDVVFTVEYSVVYRPSLTTGKPEMTVRDAQGNVTPVAVTTAPAHNYILGIDFQGDDIWVATARGLSHGIRQKP